MHWGLFSPWCTDMFPFFGTCKKPLIYQTVNVFLFFKYTNISKYIKQKLEIVLTIYGVLKSGYYQIQFE